MTGIDRVIDEQAGMPAWTPRYSVTATCHGWGTITIEHDDIDLILHLYRAWQPVAGSIVLDIYDREWRAHGQYQPLNHECKYSDLAYGFLRGILTGEEP